MAEPAIWALSSFRVDRVHVPYLEYFGVNQLSSTDETLYPVINVRWATESALVEEAIAIGAPEARKAGSHFIADEVRGAQIGEAQRLPSLLAVVTWRNRSAAVGFSGLSGEPPAWAAESLRSALTRGLHRGARADGGT